MRETFLRMLLIPFSILFFTQHLSAACKVMGPHYMSYTASVEKLFSYAYGDGGKKDSTHKLRIYNCKQEGAQKKWLSIGVLVSEFGLDASTLSGSYSGEISNSKCHIKNNPIKKIQTFEQRAALYKERTRVFRKCLDIKIKHISSFAPLVPSQNEKLCNVTKTGKNTADISGANCFFKIFPDSEFILTYDLKKECSDLEYLKENKIDLQEISGKTSIMITGDDTGVSTDVNFLSSRILRYYLEPTKKYFTLSDDWNVGVPRYNNVYHQPDLYLAKPELQNDWGDITIKTPLLVDNTCSGEKICHDGVCTSNCSYSKPAVGEKIIYELRGNKKVYLTSWYDGGIAVPNWQGLVENNSKSINASLFEVGKTYLFEMNFVDPKFDYEMFVSQNKSLIAPIAGIPNVAFAEKLAKGIPDIMEMRQLFTIGNIEEINEFTGEGLNAFNGELPRLSEFKYWPPFYSKACKRDQNSNCSIIGSKTQTRLAFQFKINGIEDESIDYEITKYEKSSKLQDNFEYIGQKNIQFPQLICGNKEE